MKENKLIDLSMDFSVGIIKLCESIQGHYSLVNQLERSATSIGTNIHEANYAHSKTDFIAKLQISLKECYETDFKLHRYLTEAQFLSMHPFHYLLFERRCVAFTWFSFRFRKSSHFLKRRFRKKHIHYHRAAQLFSCAALPVILKLCLMRSVAAVAFFVDLPPLFHSVHDGAHRLSQITQRIFNAGRHFRVDCTNDDPIFLHRAQAVRQHLLTDSFQIFSQFIEPPWPLQQIPHNQQLPFASDSPKTNVIFQTIL